MILARVRHLNTGIALVLATLSCASLYAQSPALSLSSATTNSGGTVVLSLSLAASTTLPAGLQWTLAYPPSQVSSIAGLAGTSATAASKNLSCSTASGLLTCLLEGTNTNTMASGVVATFQVTLASNAVTTAITVNSPVGVTAAGSSLTVAAGTSGVITVPTVSSLACNPANLNQAAISTCTVTLNTAALTGGATVSLSSSDGLLTVPASVTVAAGATSANFNATASSSITSNQSATVSASLGNGTQSSTVNLVAPIAISGVSCNPTSLGQNAVSACIVTLAANASAGGAVVSLGSNNPLLTVPTSVTVLSGTNTASFSATAGSSIPSNQSATITATLGSSSQGATLNLLTPVLVSTVTCSPTSLGQSATAVCTVTLSENAPSATTVTLGSNNPLLAIPATVTVAAGATTASFYSTAGSSIASNQNATLTASIGSSTQNTTIGLVAPVLLSGVACNPSLLGAAGSSNCTVNLTQAIPAISLVHVTSCGPQVFPTTTCTIPSTGSGNLIVVGWQSGAGVSTSITISNITDNVGNTYAEAGAALSVDSGAGSVADVWYAANSVSGATTLTITPSSPVSGGSAVIWEFAGADATAPLEQAVVLDSQGSSATPMGAAVTTTGAADVVISVMSAANVTGISGGGFVNDSIAGGSGWGHLITTSAGTYSAQWNQSNAGTYGSSTVAFVAAGAVTLSSNNLLLTVPASVTVPVGGSSANFTGTAGGSIPANQSAIVTASFAGASQSTNLSLLTTILVSGVTCNPTSLAQGSASTCTLTLNQNAPIGGAVVTLSSNNPLLTVPTSVTVPVGSTSTTFSVTAGVSIPVNQNAMVTATLGNSSQNATIGLLTPLVSGVVCNPSSLGPSGVTSCTVTISQTALTGGTVVTLGSGNTGLLTVAGSVTVLAGATTAVFGATAAGSIAGNQNVTVTATIGASSQNATISVLPSLLVTSVVCNPSSIGQSAVSNCTVTLNLAAPGGGTMVTLTSNNALLGVPGSVTVLAGATTAGFSATAGASIPGNQSAVVTASVIANSQTATINLLAPMVSGVVCNPASLGPNSTSTCTVSITQSAPSGGTTVTLASDNALVTVPASVTVLVGATSATFTATTGSSVPANQSANISASLSTGSQISTLLALEPVTVSGVACNPANLAQSGVSVCTVTISENAPTGGLTVTLNSNNALLTVPASVTVVASATSATFNATAGSTIPSNQSATVTAAYASSSQTATVNLLTQVLVSGVVCNPGSLAQSVVATCTITLSEAVPTGGTTVTLSSSNALLTVPGSVAAAAGATTATFEATAASSIASNQSATLTATIGASSQTTSVNLVAPILVSGVSCNPSVLAASGLSSCSVSLSQVIPAISLVHVTPCGPQTFPTSTCTIPATGSGNLIVVGWQSGAGVPTSITISSITDNAGNTYAEAGSARSVDNSAGSVADVWYAPNTVSGATTLTITPSSPVSGGSAVIWEFAGADPTAPLEQAVVLDSQSASATPTGAAVVTTGGADVVISLLSAANVSGIDGGNFNNDSIVGGGGWAHLITSSAGTYAAQWNQSSPGTYAGSTAAFRVAGTVTLTSSNPLLTTSPTVTVPVGANTGSFNAAASASIPADQNASLTATLGSSSQTTNLVLLAPILVSGVVCSPASLGQNAVSTCTVTLSQSAPSGGVSVMLSSNSGLLTVPASVTVTAGSTSATFSATASSSITSNQNAIVTATLGASSQTATIALVTPLVSGVVCNPSSAGQGASVACTVTISQTAPSVGTTVALQSNNALLTVPPSATVVSGSTSAGFNATVGSAVSSNQNATVTATIGASSQTATIALTIPTVSGFLCNPLSLVQNAVSTCRVTVSQRAPTGGTTITVGSNDGLLTAPASVLIPAGSLSVNFNVTAAPSISSNQNATVTATLGASSLTATIGLVAPVV